MADEPTAIHVPYTEPTQKMDTPTGLYRGRCKKCFYTGSATSELNALFDAQQHADAKNASEGTIICRARYPGIEPGQEGVGDPPPPSGQRM